MPSKSELVPALPTATEINDFFTELETHVKFPQEQLRQLLGPDIVKEWEQIGATQSCSWLWVMNCELSLMSFLTPNARFQPLASMSVYSLMWTFFLHPGSCHTSNLLRLYQNTLHGIEIKANEFRATKLKEAKAASAPDAGEEDVDPSVAAMRKLELDALQPVALRLGTGSLEGLGLKLATDPTRSAMGGFLVEGSQFIQWIMSESGCNKAIATQLWERMSWQRYILDDYNSV